MDQGTFLEVNQVKSFLIKWKASIVDSIITKNAESH